VGASHRDVNTRAVAKLVGKTLASCKDARTEAASDAAWELYQAAVRVGVTDHFTIREYNFALCAVQGSAEVSRSRVTAVWDGVTAARDLAPNEVSTALLARGLCRRSSDVSSTLALLLEVVSREESAHVDAYVLNVLLNVCLRDAAALAPRRGEVGGSGGVRVLSPLDVEAAAVVRESALAVWNAGKGMHNERTLTSTIKVLADAGDSEASAKVFEDAWEHGVPLDADCLAVMLRIMCCARPSREVLALYRRAQEERGLKPTTACANIVLTSCSRDGNWKSALSLWRHMLRCYRPPPDKASLAAVVLACGRSGRGDLAVAAFKEGKAAEGVEYDTVTFNVLLDACARCESSPGQVLDILMDALESQIPVDACTISSLLTAYATSYATTKDVLEQAFAIVELGKFLQVEPSPRVINSLLRVCVTAGDMPRAVKTFEEAVAQESASVDSSSVSILIEGFARAGNVAAAVERIEVAVAMGVVVTEATVLSLITACVDAGDVERAVEVYHDATRGGRGGASTPPVLKGGPSLKLINALLRGLARSGSWQEAIRLVSDDVLSDGGIVADETTVSLFAKAFEVGGEEEQAKVAQLMGIWMQETDDALIAHLLEEDAVLFPPHVAETID